MGFSGEVVNSLVYWTSISELHLHFVVVDETFSLWMNTSKIKKIKKQTF